MCCLSFTVGTQYQAKLTQPGGPVLHNLLIWTMHDYYEGHSLPCHSTYPQISIVLYNTDKNQQNTFLLVLHFLCEQLHYDVIYTLFDRPEPTHYTVALGMSCMSKHHHWLDHDDMVGFQFRYLVFGNVLVVEHVLIIPNTHSQYLAAGRSQLATSQMSGECKL